MNKSNKGADRVVSVYWFVILMIIAGTAVAMVDLFYNSPYDVRTIEADLMANKISECMSENGRANANLIFEGKINENFSLIRECSFNFEVESGLDNEHGNYYLEADFFDFDSGENLFLVSEGNPAFKEDCRVAEDSEKYGKLARCVERTLYLSDSLDGRFYEIKILSVVRKTSKNVR